MCKLSKLFLYSIFHGNLNYSSIPEESFHEIIDSCYWPILAAIKNFNFKTGIEFSANTLNKINENRPWPRGRGRDLALFIYLIHLIYSFH